MKRFRITYTDPETKERVTLLREFDDSPAQVMTNGLKIPPIKAREWAEDLAYALADKGPYTIVELI